MMLTLKQRVAIELRAAELALLVTDDNVQKSEIIEQTTAGERRGWRAHFLTTRHATWFSGLSVRSPDRLAGWLAREIYTDRLEDGRVSRLMREESEKARVWREQLEDRYSRPG